MNLLKKCVAATLSLCIAATLAAPSAGAAFSDLGEKAPATEYVERLAEKGIVKGYAEGTFGGEDVCTRGQFLTFLWRASESPAAKKYTEIKDITGSEYYADAVYWAYENGLTKIYSDGTFRADAPTDREHAAYYLYKWAKLFGKSDVTKTVLMNQYTKDGSKISADSRIPFSWAMASGLLKECEGALVKPQDPVNRLWTVEAIGTLLDNHVCAWSEWADNGDGTHTRTCAGDAAHKDTKEHLWNQGELTVKPTETEKGVVTYTCSACKLSKTEEAAPGTEFVTRADLEEAIVNTAFAYSAKGTRIQYDSTHMTELTPYLGGLIRMSPESSPELATKHNTLFSVCSNFSHICYLEALGMQDLGEETWSFGYSTANIFKFADNQIQEQVVSAQLVEPMTEKDVQTTLFRWVDFDAYSKHQGKSTIASFVNYGVFDSPSFTSFADGLTFKDDGFEGEVHYSYYDKDGKRLTYDEVCKLYLDAYAKAETTMRPGDLLVNHNHVMVYVGNNILVHSVYPKGAGKLDTKTGTERYEPNGSIYSHTPLEQYATSTGSSAGKGLMALRPFRFVLPEGFDADPANDIVKDLKIPEKTKSRIKYPMMDIDRTVDITQYGTAVQGENLTYTVEIFNKTNGKEYQTWKGADALQSYENLTVTETVPAGCEYVQDSATNGGAYKDGVITWNIAKIAPGETVALSYSVKVTAEVGSVIENGGGMVDNIPSNMLRNTVGAAKLSDASAQALAKLSESGKDALNAFGTDTAFANAIYKAIGAELDLPTVGEIAKTLFPIKKHVAGYAREISYVPSNKTVELYENKVSSADVTSPVKGMIVDRFWGGRKFYVGDDLKWNFADNCIKEFKTEFLKAGDIIVYAALTDKKQVSYNFGTVGVMVYDGKNLLASTKTPEGTTYEIFGAEKVEGELLKLLQKDRDLFFALRPSQVK